jgi:uncharacterized protein
MDCHTVRRPMNSALSTLTEAQRLVANRVLAQEAAKRSHVVISLSGAHAYGFPSPDSDLDLKCVHLAPRATLLGFPRAANPAERLEVIDGVEIDYSSNELGGVLLGVLKGNGNYFERFLSGFAMSTGPGFDAVVPLVRQALSTRVARHYAGFATQQREEWKKGGQRSAKKLLYVLRTTLTGTHVLLTGELVTDVTRLVSRYGFDDALELIEQKKRGEKTDLPEALSLKWAERVESLFEGLAKAEAKSVLPAEPQNEAELEAGLISLRELPLPA